MYKIRFYIFLFIIGIIFNSCSKEDYVATVPAYISIPSITLTTNLTTEGSASSNIVDAWVYVNDDLVGVYELPAKFPVLKEGTVSVKVYAGIKDNGISTNRTRYLLYDPHVEEVDLIPGETKEIVANVTYSADANFPWIEDFEGASLSFLYTTGSDTIFNKQSSIVKEGGFSGQVYLEDDMNFFEATSIAFNTIPKNGSTVYLEMDFKTNEFLHVGVYLDDEQLAYVTLNTTDDWKKVYLNLKDIVGSRQLASEMRVFIGVKEESAAFSTSNPQVYLDNIKLVHF